MEYLLTWTNSHEIDTIYADVMARSSNDTVEIMKYRFDSRQKHSPAYESSFILPKKLDSVGLDYISLVYETRLNFEDRDYKVSKYRYDLGDGDLYFYTPEFGIILFYWGTHRNCQRLIHTGDANRDKIVYYLTDRIISDHQMTAW